MNSSTISVCHGLQLIPTDRIAYFTRIRSRVFMTLLSDAEIAEAIPGTVTVATEAENGIIQKKITFSRAGVSEKVTNELQRYKILRLVAIYVDEAGNRRVCGSPTFPLSLDYMIEEGTYTVTLQGEDLCLDGFLAV